VPQEGQQIRIDLVLKKNLSVRKTALSESGAHPKASASSFRIIDYASKWIAAEDGPPRLKDSRSCGMP